MELNQAIQYAQLVNAAYAVDPSNLANAAGQVVNVSYGPFRIAHHADLVPEVASATAL
jgi:hypothetical protein